MLSKGDITKRDGILWGFTLKEVEPYIKHIKRDLLFREAVIGFLVDEKSSPKGLEDEFCTACKKTNRNLDCSTCSKEFKKVENEELTNK